MVEIVEAKLELSVDKASVVQAKQQLARDTGKALDPLLTKKLQLNIVDLQDKVMLAKKTLKMYLPESQRINLEANLVWLKSNLTEAKRQFNNYVNTGETWLSRLQRKFDWVWWSISKWAIALWSFVWNLASSLFQQWISKIWSLGRQIISLWTNLEKTTVAFTTMIWSSERAWKLLKDLTTFASKTPFEVTTIRDSAKQLLAYWFAVEEIIPSLKMLWDIASTTWVPLDQVALAFWQVRVKWKLAWQEMLQFYNAWINLTPILAKQLWVTEAEVSKLQETWKIWFKEVETALLSMTQKWWIAFNAMTKQSETLAWKWSNFKDQLTSAWETIWMALIPKLSEMLWKLQWVTVEVQKFLTTLWILKPNSEIASAWVDSLTASTQKLNEQLTSQKEQQKEINLQIAELRSQRDAQLISEDEYLKKSQELYLQESLVNAQRLQTEEELRKQNILLQANTQELENIKLKEAELNAQLEEGSISKKKYTEEMEILRKKTNDNIVETSNLQQSIELLNNTKVNKTADIAQLESYRQQVLRNIEAQIRLNKLIWWDVWQIKVWNLLENTLQSNLQAQKQNISNWSLATTPTSQASNIKNTNSSNVNISVNANVSWNADINKLANELARKVELANKGIF